MRISTVVALLEWQFTNALTDPAISGRYRTILTELARRHGNYPLRKVTSILPIEQACEIRDFMSELAIEHPAIIDQSRAEPDPETISENLKGRIYNWKFQSALDASDNEPLRPEAATLLAEMAQRYGDTGWHTSAAESKHIRAELKKLYKLHPELNREINIRSARISPQDELFLKEAAAAMQRDAREFHRKSVTGEIPPETQFEFDMIAVAPGHHYLRVRERSPVPPAKAN